MITTAAHDIWAGLPATFATVWAWLSSWAHVLTSTAGMASIAGATIAAVLAYAAVLFAAPATPKDPR